MSRCGKSTSTFDVLFLHCYTTSISILFNNCWSFECRMAKISLIQFVLWSQHHHSASLTLTEPSLHLSTTKTSSRCRVQEVYPWSPTSGDNSKVGICPQATSLSRSEQMARGEPRAASAADGSAAAEKEAAIGEPDGCRQNNELICSWTNVSCFCHECAAFRFKSARRVQAGRPGAGRKMQLHTVCTQT